MAVRTFVLVVALVAAPALALDETPEDLPAGAGRDETFYACTACHGTAIVRQQGQTRDQWTDTLRLMQERHGMPELDDAERELVLDYLAATFPPRARGRPNPFLR